MTNKKKPGRKPKKKELTPQEKKFSEFGVSISETTLEKLIRLIIKNTKHPHPLKTDLDRFREAMFAIMGGPLEYARAPNVDPAVYNYEDFFRMGRAVIMGITAHEISVQIANEKMGAKYKEGKNSERDDEKENIKKSLYANFTRNKLFYTNMGFIFRFYPFTEDEIKSMSMPVAYFYQEAKKKLDADEAVKAVKMEKLVKFLREDMGWEITHTI